MLSRQQLSFEVVEDSIAVQCYFVLRVLYLPLVFVFLIVRTQETSSTIILPPHIQILQFSVFSFYGNCNLGKNGSLLLSSSILQEGEMIY